MAGNFLTSLTTVSFSRRTLLHCISESYFLCTPKSFFLSPTFLWDHEQLIRMTAPPRAEFFLPRSHEATSLYEEQVFRPSVRPCTRILSKFHLPLFVMGLMVLLSAAAQGSNLTRSPWSALVQEGVTERKQNATFTRKTKAS